MMADNVPNEADLIKNLLALMQASPEAMNSAKKIMNIQKAAAEPFVKKAKQFKEADITCICLHCQTTWTGTIKLYKSESHLFVDENGDSFQVTYETLDKTNITTYTSFCDSCRKVVSMWSRSELEERYLDIMRRHGHLIFRDRREYMLIVNRLMLPVTPVTRMSEVPDVCYTCSCFDEDEMWCKRIEPCSKIV